MRKLAIVFLGLFAFSMLLTACGGGSTSTDTGTGGGGGTASGIFVDGPVTGLKYKFGSYSSVTGPGGQFTYQPGQTVTFSVGGIVIGTATGQAVMTPMSLVPDAVDVNDPAVTRMTRFLMSISTIDNAGNMTIPLTVQQAAKVVGGVLSNDTLLTQMVIQLLNNSEPPITSAAAAQAHLAQSIYAKFGGAYHGSYGGAATGTWNITIASDGSVSGTTDQGDSIGGHLDRGTIFTGTAGNYSWIGKLNLMTGVFSGTWDGGTFTGGK